MARPIYVWRLDELQDKKSLRTEGSRELKIEDLDFRLWLDGSLVVEEERQGDVWRTVRRSAAKTE